MCPLPTTRSRVFVLFGTDRHARSYCRQCAHFTTGSNEQNQHFAVLRQKVSLYIHLVVLQSGLPSLDGEPNVLSQKVEKAIAKLESDRV